MEYKAIYYDGQTSQPHDAEVEVFGNSLSIYYNEKKVVWAISEIDYAGFSGKGKTMLQYGAFPHQYLEYSNTDTFARVLSSYLTKPESSSGFFGKESNAIIKGALITISVISAVAAIIYFILLPSIASYIAGKIPVTTEISMGEKFYEGFMKNSEVDVEKTKLLNDFARKVDFKTEYPLRFTVVNQTQVNAFALPGGNIVVYSGILEKMKSSEELAALLSHEVSHIKQRHSLKRLARSLTGSLLISVIFGDSGSLTGILINQADNIYQLSFSRGMEKEADLKGLQIMYNNHLNAEGMVRLMERLHEEEKRLENNKMLAYLNSHPMTEQRIIYIKKNIKGRETTNNIELNNIWKQIQDGGANEY